MHILVNLAESHNEILSLSFWRYLLMLISFLYLTFSLLFTLKFDIRLLKLDILHADVDHRL